jgi:hypothetical protein
MAHDTELRPVTVDVLNTMVKGASPRVIRQSCRNCDVCEALYPVACADSERWQCLTVFVCNDAPSGDDDTKIMCFDRAPVVHVCFTSLTDDAASSPLTASALIVELSQESKKKWYNNECVTHVALDDAFVREHLGLTAAYVDDV